MKVFRRHRHPVLELSFANIPSRRGRFLGSGSPQSVSPKQGWTDAHFSCFHIHFPALHFAPRHSVHRVWALCARAPPCQAANTSHRVVLQFFVLITPRCAEQFALPHVRACHGIRESAFCITCRRTINSCSLKELEDFVESSGVTFSSGV